MTNLKYKLIALVSVMVLVVGVLILPGCKKQAPVPSPNAPGKTVPDTGIE